MTSWMWLVTVGVTLLLLLCGGYRAFANSHSDRQNPGHPENGGLDGGLPSVTASKGGPIHYGEMAPSSLYKGSVCFFDSVEHRDMFEANHHKPVVVDEAEAEGLALGQQGRRLERSGSSHSWSGEGRSGGNNSGDGRTRDSGRS
jgi:hypothetical protein